MKIIIAIFIFLLSTSAYAGISVCESGGKITSFTLRGDPISGCTYFDSGESYATSRNLLKTVPSKYLKLQGGQVIEMNAGEKTAVDAVETARENQAKADREAPINAIQTVEDVKAYLKTLAGN